MVIEIQGFNSKIHPITKIMSTAVVIGDVEMKYKSSVWFNAVIRGDLEKIVIGEYSNIQDCSVVHTSKDNPTIIGDNVVIGHNVTLHGCKIGDNCLIGIGAIILDGSVIGENSMIAAGTLIPPGKKIPPNSMVLGNPYKITRETTEKEKNKIKEISLYYFDLIAQYYWFNKI